MASLKLRLPENASGDFYVDSTCIDCDACRQLAPDVFSDLGGQSIVHRQPSNEAQAHRALMALVACPTGSIGTTERHDVKPAVNAFPMRVNANVYFCGFTAESSFGAWSYLVVRSKEEGGNVLIDSPRWAMPLVKRIEELGGVDLMLLTHRDDIAEHERYAARFGCPRVMHAADGAARRGIERIIEGNEAIELDGEMKIIPTPGHTRGHLMFLYRNAHLFTGDSLAWDEDEETLTAFPDVCWYSWSEQTASVARLLNERFEWVLPGHGRIGHAEAGIMQQHVKRCVEWMKSI